jgi:hypothetical protein
MSLFWSRIALCSSLLFGLAAISAERADARPASCAKKKKKKKPAAAKKPINADTLIKWRRSGMTDDEIAARAISAGYKLTAKDRAKLKKAKAKSLIASLEPEQADEEEEAQPVKVAKPTEPEKKPIDINKITREEDIDFDSVPPPTGMPKEYAQKPQEKPAAKPVVKKAPPAQTSQPSQPVAEASSTPKKRVVYTAGDQ